MDAPVAPPPPADSDISIIGGGIAALVFARLLYHHLPSTAVQVVDAPAPDGAGSGGGGKTIVINQHAADTLRRLNALPENSKPIHSVAVSRRGIGGTTVGNGSDPLGYAIAPHLVTARLREGLAMHQARVREIAPAADGVDFRGEDGAAWRAKLAVLACPLPALPPPFVTRRIPYRQTILSLTARADLPPGSARQRFSRRRILVLVPRAEDDDIGVIICAPNAQVGALNALSDTALSRLLSEEFELPVDVGGRRFAYVPQLSRTTPLAAPPLLLLGSGASTLHPVGAQAISLAVEDAETLAEIFANGKNGALPPAAAFAPYGRRLNAHRRKALLTSTLALGAA